MSSISLAKDVLHTQGIEFGSRTRNAVFDIFTVYSEHWRKMRRIMKIPFFTNKVVQQYRFGWEDEAARVVEDVKANLAIAMVVTVAEILKNNRFAVEKKIRTLTLDMRDEPGARPISKAKDSGSAMGSLPNDVV
ncbi:hypothetical protein AgCh_034070 [Apium graveolens]